MGNLAQIVKRDFFWVKPVFRGFARGSVYGTYTPALINTGTRQLIKEFREFDESEPGATLGYATELFTQGGVAFGAFSLTANYAMEGGRTLALFGALAVTNVIDYLVHAYKRSRK